MRSLCPYRAGLLGVVLGLSLTACDQTAGKAGATAVPAADRSVEGMPRHVAGSTAQPRGLRAATVQTQSFASLMQALPAKERILVSAWYEWLGGPSMDTATPAQVAWMEARHYPMPADIARAALLSESELKAAAATGDTLSGILYVARMLDNYNRVYDSVNGPSDPARYRDPDRLRLLVEVDQTMRQLLASGSPFAGYLYAAKSRLMYPRDGELAASAKVAGLIWASKFGDTRADRMLLSPVLQAVNAGTAAAQVTAMLMWPLSDNPMLFSTPVVVMPPSNQ